jgi:hypothetical protein
MGMSITKENTYLEQHRNESLLHESTVLLHLTHKDVQEKDTQYNSFSPPSG